MESDIKPPVVEPVVDSLVHFDSLETTERQDEEIQIPRRVLDDFIRLLEEQRSTLLNFRMEMDNGIGNMLLKRRDVQRYSFLLRLVPQYTDTQSLARDTP